MSLNNLNTLKSDESKHKRRSSTGVTPVYKCSKCHKVSNRKYNIARHEKGCGVKFNVDQQLGQPSPLLTPLSVTSPTIDSNPISTPTTPISAKSSRRSSTSATTTTRRKSSTSSKEPTFFYCSKCSKPFNRSDNMTRHQTQCGLKFNIIKSNAHKDVDNFKSNVTKYLNKLLDAINSMEGNTGLNKVLNFIEVDGNFDAVGGITHQTPNYRPDRYVLLDYSSDVLRWLIGRSSNLLNDFIKGTGANNWTSMEYKEVLLPMVPSNGILLPAVNSLAHYYLINDFTDLNIEGYKKNLLATLSVLFQLLDKLKNDEEFKRFLILKLSESQYDSCNFMNLLIFIQHSITVFGLLSLLNFIKLVLKLSNLKNVADSNHIQGNPLVKSYIAELFGKSQFNGITSFYYGTLFDVISEGIQTHGLKHDKQQLDAILEEQERTAATPAFDTTGGNAEHFEASAEGKEAGNNANANANAIINTVAGYDNEAEVQLDRDELANYDDMSYHAREAHGQFGEDIKDYEAAIFMKYNFSKGKVEVQKLASAAFSKIFNENESTKVELDDISNWLKFHGFHCDLGVMAEKFIENFSFIVGFFMNDFLSVELKDMFTSSGHHADQVNTTKFLNTIGIYAQDNLDVTAAVGLESIVSKFKDD